MRIIRVNRASTLSTYYQTEQTTNVGALNCHSVSSVQVLWQVRWYNTVSYLRSGSIYFLELTI